MDNVITQEPKETNSETQDSNTGSTQNFEKFTYDLFEKNGILNDLRAYLRSHIINVLRSTQTGVPFSCQKNFVQRLEFFFQALNILIAEYLLHFEYSYSLSVFVSEMPLANMVFDFAKSLMKKDKEDQLLDLRFTENDVWCILNYLGIPCDSEYASRLIQMYQADRQTSLLLCILKIQPMSVKHDTESDKVSSKDNLSSRNSSDSENEVEFSRVLHKKEISLEKCKHLKFCNTCQTHILIYKGKYKRKKKHLFKNLKSSVRQLNVKTHMKDVTVLEHSLINELFHQLKTVYENEVEMIKAEEERNLKRTMASHTLQLRKERDELEQCYKVREATLERNVGQKKKFLWGLARSLRVQHEHMSRAMLKVRKETERLAAKEEALMVQVAEAKEILRKRGEDMRLQISNELAILDTRLNSMKSEREDISKERKELDSLKVDEHKNRNNNNYNESNEIINPHYELVKNELKVLKDLLETAKVSQKCLTEVAVMTDICDVNLDFMNIRLNNTNHQNADRNRSEEFDDRLKNQVVNDFKKKNVNFTPSNLAEIYRDCSNARTSTSSGTANTRDRDDVTPPNQSQTDVIQTLKDENNRLKECARHQQIRLETLSRAASLLPCECSTEPRAQPLPPRPVPAASALLAPNTNVFPNINTSVPISVGLRKGAGEELSIFRSDEVRVLVPGDVIPFVGVLRTHDGRNTNRRQTHGHGRVGRPRIFPLVGVSKRSKSPGPVKERHGSSSPTVIVINPKASCSLQPDDVRASSSLREKSIDHRLDVDPTQGRRDKSPKSILREAKAKLRNVKDTSTTANETAPELILREAKLKLRKLEIEAEAMEKSYLDYRRKQSELRAEKTFMLQDDTVSMPQCRKLEKVKEKNRTLLPQKFEELNINLSEVSLTDYQKAMRNDFDKYLREYQTKVNFRETQSKNQIIPDIVTPVNIVYDGQNSKVHNTNYLETPLTEFRKYYQSNRQIMDEENVITYNTTSHINDWDEVKDNDSQTKLITPKKNIPEEHGGDSIASGKTTSHINDWGEVIDNNPQTKLMTPRKNIPEEHVGHSIASEIEMLKQNINDIYNLNKNNNEPRKNIDVNDSIQIDNKLGKESNDDYQNLLRIDVETVDVIEENENISIVVQSAVDNNQAISMAQGNFSPNNLVSDEITVIVSPKISIHLEPTHISPKNENNILSPEDEEHLSENHLNAIFQADTNDNDQKSSIAINLDLSKVLEISSDFDKNEELNEKLSEEVDDSDSHVVTENSPISLIKTSEDENFWN